MSSVPSVLFKVLSLFLTAVVIGFGKALESLFAWCLLGNHILPLVCELGQEHERVDVRITPVHDSVTCLYHGAIHESVKVAR